MTRRADIPRLRIGRPSCESTGSRGRALRSCAWASARWPDLNSPRSSGVARPCGDAMARTSERYGPRPANKELRNRRETAQVPVTQGCDPVATNAHDRGILSSTCGRSNARLISSSTLRTLRIISSKRAPTVCWANRNNALACWAGTESSSDVGAGLFEEGGADEPPRHA